MRARLAAVRLLSMIAALTGLLADVVLDTEPVA